MSTTRALVSRTACLVAAAGIVATWSAGPAAAASGNGDVHVVNTETVQVYADATGTPQTKRVYEQLALTGHGPADVVNPVSTVGLRNLDGFSGFTVRGHDQVVRTQVDGEKDLRSVSDYTGSLPLDVQVQYTLDGKPVSPGDVVGGHGHLVVTFVVTNVTARTQSVQVPDGQGGTTTKVEQVAVPMVGSLTTTAPSTFSHVASRQANMAGDGQGGTTLSFTMTLFPPIGATSSTFGYSADITHGVVPRVSIAALPVDPLASPTFASAARSYQSGSDTGAQLADGAAQIDANLLKLRDGSAQLLSGLLKLRDGAGQLSDGLSGQAVPGARKLSAGAGTLSSGLGRLDAGAGALHTGTGQAAAGAATLATGLSQISGGLGQLADRTAGLPHAADGIAQLKAGVDQLLAGLGSPTQDHTILNGLARLAAGLDALHTGAVQVDGGLASLADPTTGLPAALTGVNGVKDGLDTSLAAGGSLDQLAGGLAGLKQYCGAIADATTQGSCQGLADALIAGAAKSRTDLQTASGVLGLVSQGLAKAVGGVSLLAPGAHALATGLADAQAGVGQVQKGTTDLKTGTQLVRGGLDALAVGVTKAVLGVTQLSSGAQTASAGGSDLSSGLTQIDDGAAKLATGAGAADAGGKQLASGSQALVDGLVVAAGGSDRLRAGLQQAAEKAPALPDGARRLSTEGTSKLVAAGRDTATTYGEMVSVLKAGAARAHTDAMAVGAPRGALGLTAYSYVLEGQDGAGSRNLARTLGGLGVLGAAGGVFLIRRRLLG